MDTVTQFIIRTPVWVWALLAYLLWRGIKARRPARTTLAKLAVVPLIFAVWGITDLVRLYSATAESLGLWLGGGIVGGAIGWRLLARSRIRADRAAGLIERDADFTLLPLLLVTFAIRYAFGAMAAISPDLLQQTGFRLTDLLLSGMFVGIFVGKFARYARACNSAAPYAA